MIKLLISLICLFSFVWPDTLLAVEEDVKMNYVCRDLKGGDRWRAMSEIKNISPSVYLMTEKAEGIHSSFGEWVSWIAEMKFEQSDHGVSSISLIKRVFNAKGKMIRREKQDFDNINNSATCTHEEPLRNISRTRKFKFNRDVVTRLSLGLYAQKFLKDGKMSEKLQMVSEEPNVYNIELRREGKEVIEVSGRKISAYRLCVDPELGALNFVKKFFPKSYAWHSARPEYGWLKYSGLEGGVGSEKVEVSIEGL